MSVEPLTHDYLVERSVRWLRNTRGCSMVLREPRSHGVGTLGSGESPDAIGWFRGGWSVLVECKVSRSDFRRDLKKPFRTGSVPAAGQERWYLAPRGLLPVEQVPSGWGLLEVAGPKSNIRRVVDSPHYRRANAKTSPHDLTCCPREIDLLTGYFHSTRRGYFDCDHEDVVEFGPNAVWRWCRRCGSISFDAATWQLPESERMFE